MVRFGEKGRVKTLPFLFFKLLLSVQNTAVNVRFFGIFNLTAH
jgi:hypothetical protein